MKRRGFLLTAAWVLLGPLLAQAKPAVLIGWLNSDSREISRGSCIFSGRTQDARAVIGGRPTSAGGLCASADRLPPSPAPCRPEACTDPGRGRHIRDAPAFRMPDRRPQAMSHRNRALAG